MDYTHIPIADCQTGTAGELPLFALERVHRQFAGRTRKAWAAMGDDLDAVIPWGDDYLVNRRRALVDILEENLLHTGQASLVREAIDGLTGNDPPG